jgi:hypothetical protein
VESWGRGDLIRRVQQALDLAGSALTAAVDPQRRRGPTREMSLGKLDDRHDDEVRPLVATKVVAEASMLLRSADFLRHTDDQIARVSEDLAHRLVPHARNRSVLSALCQEPAFAFEHATAHIHLRDLGFPDGPTDGLLAEIDQGKDVGGPERLPTQVLERQWLTRIWSRDAAERRATPDAVDRTCIASRLDALGSSTLDLYAFTHVVLYATDMGRRSIQWPRSTDDIAADAEAGLAAAVDADNFDLAAELLWTWPMLGLPWSPAATFGFGILASAQDGSGFLPGPGYSASEHFRLPKKDRAEYMLQTSYHATFVMGFLCAAALRSGDLPPTAVASAKTSGVIDLIIPLLGTPSRIPNWWQALMDLDESRREPLAEFTLTIALRRAASNHDLELVRECLRIAASRRLDGPAVDQSLALLRRATKLGQIGGRLESPIE